MSFDIMFTRLGFENACLMAWKSLVFLQAVLKPCLGNWISRLEPGILFINLPIGSIFKPAIMT